MARKVERNTASAGRAPGRAEGARGGGGASLRSEFAMGSPTAFTRGRWRWGTNSTSISWGLGGVRCRERGERIERARGGTRGPCSRAQGARAMAALSASRGRE